MAIREIRVVPDPVLRTPCDPIKDRLFTSMEITLGSAMDTNSGSTGFSFIKVSFIVFALLL